MTSGAKRLCEWFDAGALMRPSTERETFVDLVRALAGLLGVSEFESSPHIDALSEQIGRADHYILVLIDGMGTRIMDKLPESSYLRNHLCGELQAVFPPTTAAALTTLATGHWPATHSVPGWWARLEDRGIIATTLPFVERFSGKPLRELDVAPEEVFPVPGFWDRIDRPAITIVPKPYVGSPFSTYASCGTPTTGYDDVSEAFAEVTRRLEEATSPSFTYLYVPHVDEIAHKRGVAHPDMLHMLSLLDAHLAALAAQMPCATRLLVTADHGLVDTPEDRRPVISESDELSAHLACPPTLEATVPAFHVLPGHEKKFEEAFEALLGDRFVLLTAEEAAELRLFGPEPLSPIARERIGTYLGFAERPTALYYRHGEEPVHTHVGVHASLSPDEMLIPLILD